MLVCHLCLDLEVGGVIDRFEALKAREGGVVVENGYSVCRWHRGTHRMPNVMVDLYVGHRDEMRENLREHGYPFIKNQGEAMA